MLVKELESAFANCMLSDAARLRRRLRRLQRDRRKGRGAGAPTVPEAWVAELQASIELAERRAALRPQPTFPADLPISGRREEIADAIREHQVVIVCGETGSGKSTQLPKICLDMGRGVRGFIGHTQPRRLAARTIASRIASELKTAVGAGVGYKVRFNEQLGPTSHVKLMTDGILLAETQGDHQFDAYDTLIIDEAHERSLNIDFLLGYLKILLPRRPDLKVIVTSATIDPERFAAHFGGAPIIEVSGRTYPVEVRYRPPPADDEEADTEQAIVDAVHELSRIDRGDILVFLPGEKEIRDVQDRLVKERLADTEILPLYARLAGADQQRIFSPHKRRHIVLATNVAETSLTVPGIRYVIDTGLARISRYSPRTKVQRLPIEAVAQAAADQRAGRCGRTSAGVCIRLYGEDDYASRPQFTEPEVRRANLAAVILQLAALHFGEIEDFPFLDPPEGRYINDGFKLLQELGAVDEARELTALGRQLARLPLDPRIGRMILAAKSENCLNEVLVIAAALSIQDPRERPLDRQQQADEAHAPFVDERSDFLWFLNFWRAYEEQVGRLPRRRQIEFCRSHFISPARMREWRDTWSQLKELAADMGFNANSESAPYANVHRALLSGYLSQIAFRSDAEQYVGARGIKPFIFPGSAQFKRKPKWYMSAQLVETSRLYARTVAAIEPEWVERVGHHLVRRSYSDPHWEKKAGRVMAFEKLTLLGLTLVSGRKVDFSRINVAEARDIFLRSALVEGEFDGEAKFLDDNRALIEELKTFEHKARRLDILADEQAIFEFYDARIPDDVCNAQTFEAWRVRMEATDPQALRIPREYLLRADPAAATLFPDEIEVEGMRLPLSYRFEPGHEEDGVTVTIPLLALNQLPAAAFEWLVPGLLREKISLLLRALPKNLRRQIVPVPNTVEACLLQLEPGEGALREQLAAVLKVLKHITVAPGAFDESLLPDHLRMVFNIVNEKQQRVGSGRDLEALQRQLGAQVAQAFSRDPGWQQGREGITRWDFGDLPATVSLKRNGRVLTGYPAIEDCGGSVALRVVDTEVRARRLTRMGLRRLFMLELSQQVKYLRQNLPGFARMGLHFASVGAAELLKQDLIEAAFDRAFLPAEGVIRTAAEFSRHREQGRSRVVGIANEVCTLVGEILERHHALRRDLAAAGNPAWRESVEEIENQLEGMIYPGFVTATPPENLRHFPRYLKAAALRLQKLQREPARDRQRAAELRPIADRWRAHLDGLSRDRKDPEEGLLNFRWRLEELRVSLFAQELGTDRPVSPVRLQKEWQGLVAS